MGKSSTRRGGVLRGKKEETEPTPADEETLLFFRNQESISCESPVL